VGEEGRGAGGEEEEGASAEEDFGVAGWEDSSSEDSDELSSDGGSAEGVLGDEDEKLRNALAPIVFRDFGVEGMGSGGLN
jgi:hypothetical protein